MRSSPSAESQSCRAGRGSTSALRSPTSTSRRQLHPRFAQGSRPRWTRIANAAHGRLEGLDPGAATAVHPHDRKRLIRALELAETGTSLVVGQDRLWSTETRRPTAVLGLQVDAAVLEQRIRARTVEMFTRGVVDEVRSALRAGVSPTAAKTLGLDEIARLGPDALEPIVARTRRYAAYQRKWMRRIPGVVLVDGNRPPDVVAEEILARTDG